MYTVIFEYNGIPQTVYHNVDKPDSLRRPTMANIMRIMRNGHTTKVKRLKRIS